MLLAVLADLVGVLAVVVDLGPCSFGTHTNLYVTTQFRQPPPAGVTGLAPFPGIAGDVVLGYAFAGRLVSAAAGALIGGAPAGGVDLSLTALASDGSPVHLTTSETLTLMIDTTGIYGHIDWLRAYESPGHEVQLSTGTTECPSYHIGPNGFLVAHVNVNDPHGHLSAYEIQAEFGHSGLGTAPVIDPAHRGYNSGGAPFLGVDGGYGQPNPGGSGTATSVSFVGGGDTITITPRMSCCYDFRLKAGKRVTDGTNSSAGLTLQDYWTVSIDVS